MSAPREWSPFKKISLYNDPALPRSVPYPDEEILKDYSKYWNAARAARASYWDDIRAQRPITQLQADQSLHERMRMYEEIYKQIDLTIMNHLTRWLCDKLTKSL